MNFERGKDPKEGMEIGLEGQVEEILEIYIEGLVTIEDTDDYDTAFVSDIIGGTLAKKVMMKIAKGKSIKDLLETILIGEVLNSPSRNKEHFRKLDIRIIDPGICFVVEGDDTIETKTQVFENHKGKTYKMGGNFYHIPEDYEI